MIDLRLGDCLNVMRTLLSDSIDTCITDPPYALEFMGKGWDKVLPSVDVWKEVLRVLKPGAILMAFGGTRTYHRLTVSIEDAGFEIRDCMMWLYGSGFPKSLDISKAIDKAAGAEREAVGYDSSRVRPNRTGMVMGEKPYDRTDNGATLTAPATDAARTWDGYGTALKPAWEPIVIAMKPCEGTYAENAQEWGVAGLNIDAGRIDGTVTTNPLVRYAASFQSAGLTNQGSTGRGVISHGRWPANLVLDEEAGEALDAQSGYSKSQGGKHSGRKGTRDVVGEYGFDRTEIVRPTDSGGASRFFYTAKSSKSERGDGNSHPTVKPLALMEYLCKLTRTPSGGVVLDPYMGSGTTGIACKNTERGFIGIELDESYYAIAQKRIGVEPERDPKVMRTSGMGLGEIARILSLTVPQVARLLV